jgi:hypothetical protein
MPLSTPARRPRGRGHPGVAYTGCPMDRRAWIAALMVAALVAVAPAAPALAHSPDRAPGVGPAGPPAGADPSLPAGSAPASVGPSEAAGPRPAAPWPALLALAAALIPASRSRRVAVGFLGVVLVGFAFETGTHSVHHLGEADAQCVVAGAASHVGATVEDPPGLAVPADRGDAVAPPGREQRPQPSARPDHGRAPPVVPQAPRSIA